jgi:methyl-accepting chemotaxis protein
VSIQKWPIGPISALLAWIIGRMITRPVNKMVDGLKDIAQGEGDLTKRLNEGAKDELGELASWFNAFMDKLQQLIKEMASSSGQVQVSAEDLRKIAQQLTAVVGGFKI